MVYLVRDSSQGVIKDLMARLDVGYDRCCELDGVIHYVCPRHSYMTRGLVLINEPGGAFKTTMLVHMYYTEPDGIDLIVIDEWRDERLSKLLTFDYGCVTVKIVPADAVRFFEIELGLSLPC